MDYSVVGVIVFEAREVFRLVPHLNLANKPLEGKSNF